MKKILVVILTICLCVIFLNPTESAYAQKTNKFIKAYKKFLSKKEYIVNGVRYDMKKSSFTLKDINNDKTKELIIFPNVDETCTFVIYSYNKGKIRYVLSADNSEIKYYKKRDVFVSEWMSMGIIMTHYYTYKKGKLKEIGYFSDYRYFDESLENVYKVSGKLVNKTKFCNVLKSKYKITKSCKCKMISKKMRHTVTKSNINRYVK